MQYIIVMVDKTIIKQVGYFTVTIVIMYIFFRNTMTIQHIFITGWITMFTIQYGYNAITNTGGRKDMFKYNDRINHLLRILVFLVTLGFFITNFYFTFFRN